MESRFGPSRGWLLLLAGWKEEELSGDITRVRLTLQDHCLQKKIGIGISKGAAISAFAI